MRTTPPAEAPLPGWFGALQKRLEDGGDLWEDRQLGSAGQARASAVLMLFGPSDTGGEELVLIERSHRLRSHPGQIAFPGGGREPEDSDLVQTALREAREEIALDTSGVRVVAQYLPVHIPVSGYDVTPVLAWWDRPGPIRVNDPAEVQDVLQVPVRDLTDPAHRFRVRYRGSRWIGPAFDIEGRLLWGFTAGVVDRILDLADLSQPWDTTQIREIG